MSRSVATLVYSRKCGSLIRKAILAYFADRANDDGTEIWASKQRIADEIEASRSAVIKNINDMVSEGLILIAGKVKHSNGHTVKYNVSLAKIRDLEPVRSKNQSAQKTSPDIDQSAQKTPRRPPERHKPSSNRPKKRNTNVFPKVASVLKPENVSDEIWLDWIASRKAKKASVSETALNRIAKEAERAGWPLEDALAEMVTRNWQGFKADWVKDNGGNSKYSGNSVASAGDRAKQLLGIH